MSISVTSQSVALSHIEQLIGKAVITRTSANTSTSSFVDANTFSSAVVSVHDIVEEVLGVCHSVSLGGASNELHLYRFLLAGLGGGILGNPPVASASRLQQQQPQSPTRLISIRVQVIKQLLRRHITGSSSRANRSGSLWRLVEILDERLSLVPASQQRAALDRLVSTAELCCSRLETALIGLSLFTTASKQQVVSSASVFCRTVVPEFVRAYIVGDKTTRLANCALDCVHLILTSLQQESDHFGIPEELLNKFVAALKKELTTPPQTLPSALVPLFLTVSGDQSSVIEDESIDLSAVKMLESQSGPVLLPQQILEIGYGFTASVEQCKSHLLQLRAGDGTILTPATVARVLIAMLQPPTNVSSWEHSSTSQDIFHSTSSSNNSTSSSTGAGHSLTWNGQVFAATVNSLVNGALNWTEVIVQFDQAGFIVRDRAALQVLSSALLEGLGKNPFPIGIFYQEWRTHKTGQLSWMSQILLNTDVFSFADYPHQPVQVAALKVQPEETNKEIANWKVSDLIEVLLKLSESPGLNSLVLKVFHSPLQTCPDILLLALLQCQPPINQLRQHLLQMLVPILLNGHPNAITVLNMAWNCDLLGKQTLRTIILTSLASFHAKNPDDQTKLTKILEVAHELKPNGLGELFNMSQFSFTIDLACLASRRDFLKLEKWIDDKLNEHGEQFATALLNYLKRRVPTVGSPPSSAAIPTETLSTLVTCLSSRVTAFPGLHHEFSMVVKSIQLSSADANRPVTAPAARTPAQPMHFPSQSTSPGGLLGPSASTGSLGNLQNVIQSAGGPSSYSLNKYNSMVGGGRSDDMLGSSQRTLFGRAPSSLNSPGDGILGSDLLKPIGNGAMLASATSGGAFATSHSMSPSQMLRSLGAGTPSGNQIGSSSNYTSGWGSNAPGSGLRVTPGPSNSSIDFRPQLPPVGGGGASSQNRPSHLGFDSLMPPSGGGSSSLQGIGSSTGGGVEDPSMAANFSEEIQAEANSYFQQIYAQNGQMTVQEFVGKLKQFKVSPNTKDRQVLACVVKNLFEEYKFFHEYPERELRTTAEVYGGIIREEIVQQMQFATAVRKVMEALQAPLDSMLYTFGLVALNACKPKLSSFPKICQMVIQNENFNKFPESLKAYITAGLRGERPAAGGRETPNTTNWQQAAARATTPGDGPSNISRPTPRAGTNVLSVTSVDTLVSATERDGVQLVAPPEAVIEKVAFLFNNLSQSNLPKKTEEMRQLIAENGEEFIRWLAQYLVMKRVSIEQNFQPLYNNFLMAINDARLEKMVKQETFRNIKILLRSDKRQAASNFSDRQLLKNLGLWLGAITIARDRPILLTDLDLKSLLMEAYYKGQPELLSVVPFVAKIIVSCGRSTVFLAECAWLRAILKILAELHCEPDLKLNLKFEIEVLCKELNVDIRTLEIENVLKDTDRLLRVPQQLGDLKQLSQPTSQVGPSPIPNPLRVTASPDISNQPSSTSVDGDTVGGATLAPGGQQQLGLPAHFHYHDINVVSYDGLVPHLKINASLPLFQMNPQLKHVVRTSLTNAIKELIGPVTDRAIKVAMTATEHVCRKDFALDPDEQHLRRACHSMMRAMTAGMAAITCRDPLTTTLQGYLKQSFTASLRGAATNPEQMKMIEEACISVTEDNVELATNFIVKTACEKATPEIDKRMDAEMAARAQARRENRPFGETSVVARAMQIPEKIRLKQAPITAQQMAVYDEFSSKICGFKPTTADDMIEGFGGAKTGIQSVGNSLPSVTQIANDREELVTNKLNPLIQWLDALLNHHAVNQSRGASAAAAMRDALSQLAASPRDAIVVHNSIVRLVEQLLFAYKSPDSYLNNSAVSAANSLEIDWARRLRDTFSHACRILIELLTLPDLTRRITRVVVECRLEYRFNVDALDILIKNNVINMPAYDAHLSQQIDSGSNFEATLFANRLVKAFVGMGGRHVVQEALANTIEVLSRLQQMQQQHMRPPDAFNLMQSPSNLEPSSAASVTSISRGVIGGGAPQPVPPPIGDRSTHGHYPGSAVIAAPVIPGTMTGRAADADDSPELQSKAEMILREWISLCYAPATQREPQQALAQIVQMMHEQGVLSTDDMISRFFRLCTEMCVDISYRLLKNEQPSSSAVVRQRCHYTLDAFVKLTCLMVRHSDGSQYQTKINLLKKVLNIVANVLTVDHEVQGPEFHAMPYHRIIIMMFNELTNKDVVLDPIAWNILECFGQILCMLQPRRVPGFAYSWLDIVGHRNFIGRMLSDSPEPLKTAAMYTQLIINHLKFLAPFLRNIDLPKSVAMMYKGTLRVLLVILHDFPELLCEYHYVLCDAIPPNCVQLRNLVLSAYPRNMRLPDPFMHNLKVDNLPDMSLEPKMHVQLASIIPENLRANLDNYLESRSPVSFLSDLPRELQVSTQHGSKYNTTVIKRKFKRIMLQVMNAVVLYVGIRAIESIFDKQQRISMTTIAHSAYMDIFQNLAVSLCTEGRYLLFNAIANQLRYPNCHTHYFSYTLLYLFLEANIEVIQEQITRILFERLVALRPHPWGLLITFIELIKNPSYNFWKHEFTRCAPEIERLFQSVANSCMGTANSTNRPPAPANAVDK